MTEFEYRGTGPKDTAMEGRLNAANINQANKLLDEMQVRVSELRVIEPSPPKTRAIGLDDFNMLNEQIIAMVTAGVPLEEGFQHMASDLAKPRLRKLINTIAEDLAHGTPLDEAIRKHQQAFPILYARIIAVGLRTGRLAVVLTGFNRYLEFVSSIRRVVWEAVSYPAVILVLGLIIFWFISQTIAPQFETIFKDFGTTLPVPTQIAFALSKTFKWLIPSIVIALTLIVTIVGAARGPRARRIKEQVLLHLPVAGTMLKNCLIARFTQGLSLMVRVGLPFEEAVMMAGEATGSPTVMADTQRIRDALTKGQPIQQALLVGRVLPRFLGQTVQIALDRSQLQECLEELSRLYDQRAQQGLTSLQAFLLPMAVIILGGAIGMNVLAFFLPLVKLISSVSGGK
jgi:type IV pilus assembly protein PilC